jgi:hypothetical protein
MSPRHTGASVAPCVALRRRARRRRCEASRGRADRGWGLVALAEQGAAARRSGASRVLFVSPRFALPRCGQARAAVDAGRAPEGWSGGGCRLLDRRAGFAAREVRAVHVARRAAHLAWARLAPAGQHQHQDPSHTPIVSERSRNVRDSAHTFPRARNRSETTPVFGAPRG